VRGLGDVRVIRQSVGAQLAAHLAGQAPNRVRAMLLQGPVFAPTYRTVLRGLGRWLADMPCEHPGLAVREVPDQVGPRRVARCCGSRCRTGSRTRWPVSTYLCWSSWASTTRCPAGDGGARWRVPGGAPVVMPGLPHSAPNAAPERFARLVRDSR
jgi:pimeloyl-ACP methyl ester carboxylesterase